MKKHSLLMTVLCKMLFCLSLSSCSGSDDKTTDDLSIINSPNYLVGTWYWSEGKDYETVVFKADGTVTDDYYIEYGQSHDEGTYEYISNTHVLLFNWKSGESVRRQLTDLTPNGFSIIIEGDNTSRFKRVQ